VSCDTEWKYQIVLKHKKLKYVGEIQEFETANSLLIKQMVSVLLASST
jgi:hypothetical protein